MTDHSHGHDHGAGGHDPDWPRRMQRLNDTGRLDSQISEADLARLLDLRGDESVLDLGSGTGFYTDRIAELTTGTVYALEIIPEMLAHYRERGLPGNVRLVDGDMTALGALSPAVLAPASIDVAATIATWHEIDGRLDAPGLARLLRPTGRLVVVDWRKEPATWDFGPPEDVRFSEAQVAESLAPHFTVLAIEDVGPAMFALVAERN